MSWREVDEDKVPDRKHSFPYRYLDTWNDLEEIVKGISVHEFKVT